jgi:small subunit ribosomal protein S17
MEANHKTLVGRVVGNKMQKTIVVAVDVPRRHVIYKKVMHHMTRFQAHDEKSECKLGDVVKLVETRPYPKLKDGVLPRLSRKVKWPRSNLER